MGIEPTHKCFADTRVSTSPRDPNEGYFIIWFGKTEIPDNILQCLPCQNNPFLLNFPSRMKKLRTIILILLGLGILAGIGFFLVGYFRRENAGILVESNPTSSVYIGGEQVGRTPYDTNLSPGEVVVKLIPEATDKALTPFETKVTLSSGIKTIIRREFGETEESSVGEIVSFEKVGGKEVSISVVSIPNSAQIAIDGTVRGFAPYKTTALSAGEHSLVVSSQGYIERVITVKGVEGYRLTAVVKLRPSGDVPEIQEGKTPPDGGEKKILIEILPTPTGFLRIRETASTLAKELAQVKPGERFPFLEEDTKNNWFKVEYLPAQAGEKAKEGWVTGQYAKKVEVEAGVSVTPTPGKTASPSATLTPTKKPTPSPTPKPTATP